MTFPGGCRSAAFLLIQARSAVLGLICGLVLTTGCGPKKPSAEDEFQRLTSQGRSFYESGDAIKAVEVLTAAMALQPGHPDAHQNLANALLRANEPIAAEAEARELIRLNQNLGAAHYLLGAALLRQGKASAALPALQTARDFDRTINAASYLLGRAHQDMGQLEDAAALFDEVVQFETNHPAAYYNLSQVLTRLGRTDEASQALERHTAVQAQRTGAALDQSTIEACLYTEILVPFRLEQPDPRGTSVSFTEVTRDVLPAGSQGLSGPFAFTDVQHDGRPDLFAREGDGRFRLLLNSAGILQPAETPIQVTAGARYGRVLVGDLNRDRSEDIVILGDQGLHALRVTTNGLITDTTAFSNLRNLPAVDGLLADLDFTGNLDLVLVTPGDRSIQVWRNLGNMYFTNGTASAGFPADLGQVRSFITDDWNGDELNDFFIGRAGLPPFLLSKERGGPLALPPATEAWPTGMVFTVADFNNDLRNDIVVAETGKIVVTLNGLEQRFTVESGPDEVRTLVPLDYDNDGWLDLFAATSKGLKSWRNLGRSGLLETSAALGLSRALSAAVDGLAAADIDNDGDSDLFASLEGGGLKVLRNNGGNANHQLQIRLLGTRSNPSGIGLRIELSAGNWRALRTVHQLPVEIGVGRKEKIDTINVRWFDALSTDVDTPVQRGEQLTMIELVRPTGSCPYLYRWDGQRYTFVTDLLGASPLGLPVAPGRYIEPDPDEIVWIGDDRTFVPRNGYYSLQITEELREVLYLDEARLLFVDHPLDVEVHPTDKLVPGSPFPSSGLRMLRRRIPLRQAADLNGTDVTSALQAVDERMVSPLQLRPPQQRGYAEPHGIVLDFGDLSSSSSYVLALTGWLRFGGGMANMSASRDPELPFPFPELEAELASGWKPVDVVVGAPCGKTKTILVDLQDHLPKGAKRLRLTTSFEIHWDRIALFDVEGGASPFSPLGFSPDHADLHWRGYSEFLDRPWTQALTPDYERVRSWPDWRITPSGWCTRYGAVDELVTARDGGMVVLNGGDELTLEFSASRMPPIPAGMQRSFFLWTVGWDKDADFHVVQGDRVEPLPWEGMDAQQYGREERPTQPGDELNRQYNTRWVGPLARLRKR